MKHEAIIDVLVQNPQMKVTELALHFGTTIGWMSVIMHSEVFKEALAKKNEVVFNEVVLPTRARMQAVADASYEKLADKVPFIEDPKMLLEIADRTANKLGYGPNKGPDNSTTINNSKTTIISVGKDVLAEARGLMAQQNKDKESLDGNASLPAPS